MRLIINGKDVTGLTWEVTEFRGEILLPLNFLETLQDSGIQVTKTAGEFKIDLKPEALLKLLSKDHPFPAELSLNVATRKDGKINAKAELGIGNFGKASIDQDGKIEAGFNLKF